MISLCILLRFTWVFGTPLFCNLMPPLGLGGFCNFMSLLGLGDLCKSLSPLGLGGTLQVLAYVTNGSG